MEWYRVLIVLIVGLDINLPIHSDMLYTTAIYIGVDDDNRNYNRVYQ
jgi:hypothetical protein